jgi:ribosomal 30S subunit maturation factor RimM
MSCPTCQETKPIPKCVDTLIIGAIEDDSTNIYIYVENLTTGRIQRIEATSGISGEVSLDLTDPDKEFYSANFTYELWVTLRTGTINDKLDITILYTVADCFVLRFEEVFDGEDIAEFTEHELEIDD